MPTYKVKGRMRVRRRKTGRRAAGRRGAGRRVARIPRRTLNGVPEWASCSSTLSLNNPVPLPLPAPPQGFGMNVMYQKRNFELADHIRAVSIAQGYQFFRITRITLTFKPMLDTFSTTGTGTVPQFYYMLDKSGSMPAAPTVDYLRQMGARPRRFDDKNVVVSWRPSVLDLSSTDPAGASAAHYRISPWLSTNANQFGVGPWGPSVVDHLGLYWFARQDTPGANNYFTIECTVDFQFKKPLAISVGGAAEAIAV